MTNIGDTYALIITEVRAEHQGVYTIKAENLKGDTECSTKLIVTAAAPEIESRGEMEQ